MSIKVTDYYKGYDLSKVPKEHQDNTHLLILKVNNVLIRFGEDRPITSGYRSIEKHKAIYAQKNASRAKQGLPPLTVPMGSKHLIGAAIDIADSDGKLKAWLDKNPEILVEFDLYCEEFSYTSLPTGWCHFQTIPPKSGKHRFIP